METTMLETVARQTSLAVGLTFDPDADENEQWIACVGLDAQGAGRTPYLALKAALDDLGLAVLAQGDDRQAAIA